MDRNIFPEGVAVPDLDGGGGAAVFQVLTTGADGAEGKELVVFPNPAWSLDNQMGMKPGAVADMHVVADDAVRADFHLGSEFGLGRDDGGRMNRDGAAQAGPKLLESVGGESLRCPKFSEVVHRIQNVGRHE